MYKIVMIAGLVLIMAQLNINSKISCQTTTPVKSIDKYSLEILPVNGDNICLIKFTLEQECFVKIKVMDMINNETEYLLKEEMQAGKYNIYYKSKEILYTGRLNCSIEVLNKEMEIVFSNELIINN